MNWIRPPETVRRFTPHQLLQHWIAGALWVVLAGSSLAGGAGVEGSRSLHATAGIAGLIFLGYHAIVLAAIGVRLDMPAENVAFLPWGPEWSALRRRKGSRAGDGKYSPAEKGDYLAILAWSLLAAASGILLRWPSFFGVPGASAYDWIRTVHAGFGAALTVHLLAVHLPQRWWYAAGDFRRAIFKGTVTLREAEKRGGWVRDLVARGILVPTPETAESAEDRESTEVRELLERGNRFAREGKYGEACNSYKEALLLLPDYSQARFNLAVALMRNGRSEEAREQLAIFIEKDPFNPMVEKAREMLDGYGKGTA
ncbi:MAG: tetratricopeptide repeat protein [bacterium]|jgi:thiosulfate reductase cytochrome b subunit